MEPGSIHGFFGKVVSSARFCILRQRQSEFAALASAVFSMTRCTRCWDSRLLSIRVCITSPWEARSTMPGSPHCRRTSFNRETARCEDDGVSRLLQSECAFHPSPHRGCPMVWANAANMTLKLMLILISSLWLASTECGNQAGKTISVPGLTAITT